MRPSAWPVQVMLWMGSYQDTSPATAAAPGTVIEATRLERRAMVAVFILAEADSDELGLTRGDVLACLACLACLAPHGRKGYLFISPMLVTQS